jgi:LPXTG-site transpeptidase (sortase) family protein
MVQDNAENDNEPVRDETADDFNDDDDFGDDDTGGGGFRPPLPVLAGIAAVVVAFVAFLLIALGGGGGDDGNGNGNGDDPSGPSAGLLTPTRPTPVATLDLTRPTVVRTIDPNEPRPGQEPGDRVIISAFGVDAPITYRTVGPDGVMPDPDGPDDIAFYEFPNHPGLGGVPGFGGNVVLAGHVDSGFKACKNGTVPPPCTAVLWDVHQLKPGDEIQIEYGGKTFVYRVTSNEAVDADSAPWEQIVASTEEETVTIITCGGDFNRATGSYESRQVVAGVLVTS